MVKMDNMIIRISFLLSFMAAIAAKQAPIELPTPNTNPSTRLIFPAMAKIVKTSYLQANDDKNYKKWM